MTERNTTDVLHDDLDDNDNVAWLLERFHKVAKTFVLQRLSEECRVRADVEQIVQTSLRRAIQAAQKDPKWRDSSEMFVGLLKKVGQRRAASEVRRQKAQGRDAGREIVPSKNELFNPQDRSLGDLSKRAEIKETLKIVLSSLLQEKDEQRRLINLLGITLELNAAEIHAILQEHPDGFRVASLPTIRTQIESARGRLDQLDLDQYQPEEIEIDFDEAA